MPHLETEDIHVCQEQCAALQRGHAALQARVKRTSLRIPVSDLLAPADFVDVKRKDVRHGLRALYDRQRDLLAALVQHPRHAPLQEALADVRDRLEDKEKELVLLTRQGTIVAEDLENERRVVPTIEDAYLSVVSPKLMLPAAAPTRPGAPGPTALKATVLDFYGALRPDCGGAYCSLFGLTSFAAVRAAPIVPLGLQSHELACLFGVRDIDLTDPRNHLPLSKTAQRALDDGLIVFVPVPASDGGNVQWQCRVVDASRANELAVGGRRWKGIDGRLLQFQSERRPAARFLFFRLILTYLEWVHTAEASWVKTIATCGPFPSSIVNWSMLTKFAYAFRGVDLPLRLVDMPLQKCLANGPTAEDEEASEFAEDVAVSLAARWRFERSQRKDQEFYESSDEDKALVTNGGRK